MFDNLSQSINKAWKMVQKDGKLTPENMKEPMKEIRRALLEADVSLPVVRRFVKRIEERALGVEVLDGVSPDVQFVKVRRWWELGPVVGRVRSGDGGDQHNTGWRPGPAVRGIGSAAIRRHRRSPRGVPHGDCSAGRARARRDGSCTGARRQRAPCCA
jgi:hypothetical protein